MATLKSFVQHLNLFAMSYLAATLMQNLRTPYEARLDKNELRRSNYGGYDVFVKQTNSATGILSPAAKAIINRSFAQTTQIPVINNESITISNTRTCAIQTGGPESALVSLTFVTYSFGFPMYRALLENNEVEYATLFNKNLTSRILKLKETIDSAAISTLNTNKNIFWTGTSGFYAQTGNALQVPQADRNLFFANLSAILGTMDFPAENIDVVTNFGGMPLVNFYQNQGAGNQTNFAYQFGPYNFYFSNRVANGAGVQSTHYAVAQDSVALATRVSPDNRLRSVVGNGLKRWDTVMLPELDFPIGYYYVEDCTDATTGPVQSAGITGMTQTKVESHEWSVDVAYVTAYNSAAASRFNPIVKAEILTT